MNIDVQSFDIPRAVSVYADQGGINWWTKAWFNNRKTGEAAVAINRQLAIRFWHDEIDKEAWLEEYFPKQMKAYHTAIAQTKNQLTRQMEEYRQKHDMQLNL